MRIPYYHVDAFTARAFGGNPAGVCVLEEWLADDVLQKIAAENNLSETAFFTRLADGYHLRWFAPQMEVDLCGHATLATAHVLFSELGCQDPILRFHTRSGILTAARQGNVIELDFPSRPPVPCVAPDALLRGLGRPPLEVLRARDLVAVYASPGDVAALAPDMTLLEKLDCLGVIATAPGTDADFVSRFFAPRAGVPEDPATGSSHSSLIPFWSGRLGKTEMLSRQLSRRGGEFYCRLAGDRVGIGGHAVVYGRGELQIYGATQS